MRKHVKIALIGTAAILLSALLAGVILLRSPAMHQTLATSRGSTVGASPEPLPTSSLAPVTMSPSPPNVSTAQNTLDSFCHVLETRDYNTQYHLLSRSGQAQESLAHYISRQEQVDTQIGGITSCTGVIARESESSASCSMIITEGNGGAGEIACSLVREDGSWKMNNIHPQ